MVNYQQGKIYRFVSNKTGKQYIGGTTQKYLSKRLSQHKEKYLKWKEGKETYNTSFIIIEDGDYEIVLLETYPCNNKYELDSRERHYIETIECVNKYIPTRTTKEYYETHKDRINEKRRGRRKINNLLIKP